MELQTEFQRMRNWFLYGVLLAALVVFGGCASTGSGSGGGCGFALSGTAGDFEVTVACIKNIAIGILTADCAPILFYDPNKKIIGCAHVGWKGALNGIIKNTTKKFNDLNSNNNDLIAVIGPCINKKNYEVKIDFFKKFINQDKKNENFFEKISDTQYNFDLRGFINKELFNLGIKKIENIEMDTFLKKELFYSFRRSRLNKEQDFGRCISVILMT